MERAWDAPVDHQPSPVEGQLVFAARTNYCVRRCAHRRTFETQYRRAPIEFPDQPCLGVDGCEEAFSQKNGVCSIITGFWFPRSAWEPLSFRRSPSGRATQSVATNAFPRGAWERGLFLIVEPGNDATDSKKLLERKNHRPSEITSYGRTPADAGELQSRGGEGDGGDCRQETQENRDAFLGDLLRPLLASA